LTDVEREFIDHLIDSVTNIGEILFGAKSPEGIMLLAQIVDQMLESWANEQTQEYYHSRLSERSNDGEGWEDTMASNFPRDDHPELYDILYKETE